MANIGMVGSGPTLPGYAPMSQGGGWLGSQEELHQKNVKEGRPNTLLLKFPGGGVAMMDLDQVVKERDDVQQQIGMLESEIAQATDPRRARTIQQKIDALNGAGGHGWDALGDAESIIGPDGKPMTLDQARQYVANFNGRVVPGGPGPITNDPVPIDDGPVNPAPGPGRDNRGPGYQGPPNRGIPDDVTRQLPPTHQGIRFNPITKPAGPSPFQPRQSPGGLRPDIPGFDAWSRIPDVVLPPTFDYTNPQHSIGTPPGGAGGGIVETSVAGAESTPRFAISPDGQWVIDTQTGQRTRNGMLPNFSET